MLRTLSTVSPYLIERAPEELFAAMPPSVARLAVEGSIGKKSLCFASALLSCPRTMPGRTRTRALPEPRLPPCPQRGTLSECMRAATAGPEHSRPRAVPAGAVPLQDAMGRAVCGRARRWLPNRGLLLAVVVPALGFALAFVLGFPTH